MWGACCASPRSTVSAESSKDEVTSESDEDREIAGEVFSQRRTDAAVGDETSNPSPIKIRVKRIIERAAERRRSIEEEAKEKTQNIMSKSSTERSDVTSESTSASSVDIGTKRSLKIVGQRTALTFADPSSFWISPMMVTIGTSFYAQYVRPDDGGPTVGGWIGLFAENAGPKDYVTYYKDTDAYAETSIAWSRGPPTPGKWEMRYYDKDYNLLSSQVILAKRETVHAFTRDYPSSDNAVTLRSSQPQTPLWPSYLPIDDARLFVMERSKNPSLVVYYCNVEGAHPPQVSYQKLSRPLPSRIRFRKVEPVRVRWYSWGWTPEPELNSLSTIQVPFMGATFKKSGENVFEGSLNALSSKRMRLCTGADPRTGRTVPMLVGKIGGSDAFLRKVYVKTESGIFGPKVVYADLYGVDLKSGAIVRERLNQS